MIIALWIVTVLLAVLFAMAGAMKAVKSREAVLENMAWVEEVSAGQLKTIGLLELAGAIGLVLPAATGMLPWLTPVAAFALAITMVFAVALHVKRKESFVPSLVLGVVALAVGIGWLLLG
jgi:uncharacterized membrane protein YphA (DoxX/SURF4 family)